MSKIEGHLILGVVAVIIAGLLGWQEIKAQGADWLPVKYVRIEGAFQYIAKDKIKLVIRQHVNNGLYNADIQHIQKSVMQLAWVENVRVKRVWPDAIDIKIGEQKPVVRWGMNRLLNAKGEVFTPENMEEFSQLPVILGLDGHEKEMLEIMKGITLSLTDQAMELVELHVNDRKAWSLKLRSGMDLKLGRNKPLSKFQRFLQTLGLFSDELVTKIAVVDLRYPNGYALTWKKGEEEIDWKNIAEMRKI